MFKTIAGGILGLLLLTGSAAAQSCSSLPYTLTNGSTADATQVMANFACVFNSPAMAGPVGIGMVPTNILDITQNQNAGSYISVLNNNTSSSALAGVVLTNGTDKAYLQQYGSGFSNNGVLIANGFGINATSAANLALDSGGPIQFAVNNSTTEVARFDSSGHLLLNTTTDTGGRIGIYFNGSSSNGININDTSATSGAEFIQFFTTGTAIGEIINNGNTAVAYNTTSDARLKNILSNQTNYRSTIENIWVGDFEWKKDKSRSFGILAQQTYPLYPEAVTKPVNETGIWEADYGKLAPLALWGVKDLYKVTDEQNIQLSTLEAQMKSLAREVVSLQHASDSQVTEIGRLRTRVGELQRKIGIQTAQK